MLAVLSRFNRREFSLLLVLAVFTVVSVLFTYLVLPKIKFYRNVLKTESALTLLAETAGDSESQLEDLQTEIDAADWLTLSAAWRLDEGLEANREIASAKVYATEMLARVTDEAIQIFGGMGLMDELPLERFKELAPVVEDDVYEALTVEAALAKRGAPMGTSPERVKEALAAAQERWIQP